MTYYLKPKDLEWNEVAGPRKYERLHIAIVSSKYSINYEISECEKIFTRKFADTTLTNHRKLEKAKEVAQKHFESFVKSLLKEIPL